MTGVAVSRRAVLGGAVGAAAGAALTGCAGPGRPVQVVVVWSGAELARFREVVSRYHRPVDVVSVRDDMDAFLRARYSTASQPDVAILPQIGLIADYHRRGWLVPVDPKVAGRFTAAWNDPLRVDGILYGAWVKASHKSLVWYRPDTLSDREIPRNWGDFVSLVRRLAAARGPAPLAIGAADGWVLTDWFENVLASVATADEYRRLTTGQARWDATAAVRTALERLAEVWSVSGAFAGGARLALLTQHEDSVLQVFAEHRATMVYEGDFVASVATAFQPAGAPPPAYFRFPQVDGQRSPTVPRVDGQRSSTVPRVDGQRLLAAGDAAIVFRHSAGGADLVDWLTGETNPFRRWIRDGGFLSPNLDIPPDAFGDGLAGELADQLRRAGESLRIDLSDQLRGTFGGPDGLGMWKVLQDFFASVAVHGTPVRAAVTDTCRALQRTADQANREART